MRTIGKNKRNIYDNPFWLSNIKKGFTYWDYYNRLTEIALTVFEWKNLPDNIDSRFLELALYTDGFAVFFHDNEINDYLGLRAQIGGTLDVYNVPMKRTAYAANGYRKSLTNKDSVLIYNNYQRLPTSAQVLYYAKELERIDRTIKGNLYANKKPFIITCDQSQKLSLENLMGKYDNDEYVIYAYKNLDPSTIQCLNTNAPYLCDRLYDLKTKVWNECLTYLGIPNTTEQKKERLIVDEVERSQGGVIANRFGRLEARRYACKQINKMFGLNVDCVVRQDFDISGGDSNEQLYNDSAVDMREQGEGT